MASRIIGQGTAAPIPQQQERANTRTGGRPTLVLVGRGPAGAESKRATRRYRAGLQREELHWANSYTGTAEALVVARICRIDQLPGQPGNQKTSCTYYRGEPCRRVGAQRDENYMAISVEGKTRFRVLLGVPRAERERRLAALRETEALREKAEMAIEYQEACERLAKRRRESTPAVFRDQLLSRTDGVRRDLQTCQEGEDLLHDWCLSATDLALVLKQVEALEQVMQGVTPIRFGGVQPRRLQVVAS